MLDSFAELFRHCWGHARALYMVSKVLWVVSIPRCTARLNIVGSCCNRMHTSANTNATTPSSVGSTWLGVVATVCTPLPAQTQQLPALLGQHCWELVHPYAHHWQHERNNFQHCWAKIVGSCCIGMHSTANTDATTPSSVGPKLLGVVACVFASLPLRTQQTPLCTWHVAFVSHAFALSAESNRNEPGGTST